MNTNKMAEELRHLARQLDNKELIRKRPYKSRQVCHNCKFFVREEPDQYVKYVDGICIGDYPSDYHRRKVRELFETCSRFQPAPFVEIRTKALKTLNATITMTDKQDGMSDVYKGAVEIRNYILQTHKLTQEGYNAFMSFGEFVVGWGKQREIQQLEEQWNAEQDERKTGDYGKDQ